MKSEGMWQQMRTAYEMNKQKDKKRGFLLLMKRHYGKNQKPTEVLCMSFRVISLRLAGVSQND